MLPYGIIWPFYLGFLWAQKLRLHGALANLLRISLWLPVVSAKLYYPNAALSLFCFQSFVRENIANVVH